MSPFNIRTLQFVNFTAIQAEYRDFIWNIATEESLSGYQRVEDLPELSDEHYRLVIRAHPDLNGESVSVILQRVLSHVQTECDRLSERVAQQRNEDLHGSDSPQTDRERASQKFEHCATVRALIGNEHY